MKKKEFYIEPPRKVGEEAEFFMMDIAPYGMAASAHIHNALEMIYVTEGSYSILLDGTPYQVKVGDLILFCSNSIHNAYANGEAVNRHYVIKLPPTFFLEFARREAGARYLLRFAINRKENKNFWTKEELKTSPLLPILNDLIYEHEHHRYASEVAIRLKIMELLVAILREDETANLSIPRGADLVYQIMMHVHNHYAEDIDEKEMAARFGMSYSYFSRTFKQVTGMPFRKYLNVTRIHKAEQMLFNGTDSITEIALKCGYNSISYFISVYRSITGKTPYQVLRQTKARGN